MASDTSSAETEPQLQHIINIPEKIEPALSDECCIYTVPAHLKMKSNAEAYTPRLISIGPLHFNKSEELKKMEKEKQRYFLAFWKRLLNKHALVKYKTFLEDNKEKICNSYSEPITLCNDQFVDLILLDSVFIMELFLRNSNESEQKDDYIFNSSWVRKSIRRDLFLLENQLPIFVLEELYWKAFKKDRASFLELVFNYFEGYYPHNSTKDEKLEMIKKNCTSCNHFTDLIRYFYISLHWDPSKEFTVRKKDCVPKTATKLNEAGISFEKVQGRDLLDINIKKIPVMEWFLCLGCLPYSKCFEVRLQFPQLKIDTVSECIFRNLIALEQCHYPKLLFVCSYVWLIDSLIHTKEDVELLVDKGILVHDLGSHKELATLVNGLCDHVVVTPNFYGKLMKQLDEHYGNKWKHQMGMLRSVYFRDPWRFSSTIVGITVFIFAIVNFLRVVGLAF